MLKRLFIALAAAFAITLAVPVGAAQAAVLGWSFVGQRGIDSRTWTTDRKADIWITSGLYPTSPAAGRCVYRAANGGLYTLRYQIKVLRDDFLGWSSIGTQTVTCGSTPAKLPWYAAKADKYKFRLTLLSPAYGYTTVSGGGFIYTNGSHP